MEWLEREEKTIYMGCLCEISLLAKCRKSSSAPIGWLHVALILLDFFDLAKTSPMVNTLWTIFAISEIFANSEFLQLCFLKFAKTSLMAKPF